MSLTEQEMQLLKSLVGRVATLENQLAEMRKSTNLFDRIVAGVRNALQSLRIYGKLLVETTDAEALLVRKAGDTGDVFTVDTTNGRIGVNTAPSVAMHVYSASDNVESYIETDKVNGTASLRLLNDAQEFRIYLSPSDTFVIRDVTNSLNVFTFAGSDIFLAGTQYMKETAAASADIASYGQLWVKNTTPCELWFTDDAGTDTQLA